jgi:hypothetical protein
VASEEAAEASRVARGSAEEAFTEAQAFLEVTRSQYTGSAEGQLWWMDRELEEAKK